MANIKSVIDRYVENVIPSKKNFEEALNSTKKMTIYIGADPTAPKLHLGHSTNFLVLKALQDMGHKIIFLIGDFTGLIGDPTDKNATRKPLTKADVKENAKTYKDQLSKILDFEGENPAEIKFNSEWLGALTPEEMIKLAAMFTVQQMIERDMFQVRLKENKPISLHEFLYPLFQGYDSVAMNVDAEMGGNDQTFNMMVGRQLLRQMKGKEKYVITTKLLINPKTGKKLMSKSEGNYVGLNDSPEEMYGKIMALPDEVIKTCFELCTTLDLSNINFSDNPMNLKKHLAREIVKMYHSEKDGKKAEESFSKTFSEKMPEFDIKVSAGESLAQTISPFTNKQSVSDAKRQIKQGGVDVNGQVVNDSSYKVAAGDKIQVGKKTYLIAK